MNRFFDGKKEIEYDTLDLSFKDEKLFMRLAMNSKIVDKKKRLKQKRKKITLGESMQVEGTIKTPKKRGRKPTGKNTQTIALTVKQSLYDRIESDLKKKRDDANFSNYRLQNIIKDILMRYYEDREQLSLFENQGN